MKIPFLDLKSLHAPLKKDILAEVSDLFDNNAFVLGPYTQRFEKEWAAFVGRKLAIGVQSGTAALSAALWGLNIGPGDEVITAANTFVATVGAIHFSGAKPVLVDIDPESYNMDPTALEAAITKKTKAIIPVHLYGQMADMKAISEIAKKQDLKVIEDASQAHGATQSGASAGSIGDIGCFSFYPGKNLGAAGEAGAAVTDDPELEKRMQMFRNHGGIRKYEHLEPGLNLRMEAFQAIVLSKKLPLLNDWNNQRRSIAAIYNEKMANLPIKLPQETAENRHVYHLYVIQSNQRESLAKHLNRNNIAHGLHYPQPIHLLPAYKHLGYQAGHFPETEKLANNLLSLPIFPGMSEAQAVHVTSIIKNFFD